MKAEGQSGQCLIVNYAGAGFYKATTFRANIYVH